MNSLAKKIVDAHGGLETWNRYSSLTAHLNQGGALWELKGQGGKLDETNVTVGLRDEWASHSPLGPEGKVTRFEPGVVMIQDSKGTAQRPSCRRRRRQWRNAGSRRGYRRSCGISPSNMNIKGNTR